MELKLLLLIWHWQAKFAGDKQYSALTRLFHILQLNSGNNTKCGKHKVPTWLQCSPKSCTLPVMPPPESHSQHLKLCLSIMLSFFIHNNIFYSASQYYSLVLQGAKVCSQILVPATFQLLCVAPKIPCAGPNTGHYVQSACNLYFQNEGIHFVNHFKKNEPPTPQLQNQK